MLGDYWIGWRTERANWTCARVPERGRGAGCLPTGQGDQPAAEDHVASLQPCSLSPAFLFSWPTRSGPERECRYGRTWAVWLCSSLGVVFDTRVSGYLGTAGTTGTTGIPGIPGIWIRYPFLQVPAPGMGIPGITGISRAHGYPGCPRVSAGHRLGIGWVSAGYPVSPGIFFH